MVNGELMVNQLRPIILEIKASTAFNLDFPNESILSCFFFFY